jgi:exodeoxyribonuclease V alpha subunit
MTAKLPETISGAIERVTYFNPENGYSVLKIIPDKSIQISATARDGTLAVVGVLPELNPGEAAEFTGEWNNDPKYGLQFRAHSVRPIQPTSKRGITRYLSELVKGIGERTAERIVDHFGVETLEVLNHNPERLEEVPYLSLKKAVELADVWANNRAEREALMFLQGYGVTAKFARRIYKTYGDETITVLRQNPYRLADELFGVGFLRADSIALEIGLDRDSPKRIGAGLSYTLSRLSKDGHTYAPREVLVNKTAELLSLNNLPPINEVLTHTLRTDALFMEHLHTDDQMVEAIYLPRYYYSERGCTRLIRQLTSVPSQLTLNKPQASNLDAYIREVQAHNEVKLTAQQTDAVKAAITYKISVLTGGPGTGKTTTLRMVLDTAYGLNCRVALAAPTGRAAKRLQQATQHNASTIHRLLGFKAIEGFEYNEDKPLHIDLLVLDETSMLDLILFYNVLKAVPVRANLMLVGDVDQLPSVGAGNVLRDMIRSGIAHVTRLDSIFRQDDKSHIVSNAHRINRGQQPILNNKSKDFFFFSMQNPPEVGAMVVDVVVNRVPEKFGYNPLEDIQVLAPMYRGPDGVDAINDALQQNLNGDPRTAEVRYDGQLYRVGDRVMQTRNNYDKDVFNGDSGRVQSIDPAKEEVNILTEDSTVTYRFNELDQLVLSYCISIHRSQGSEYPVVVIPITTSQYVMLQRNLLYTAITRARKLVVLVGQRKAVAIAVNNNKVEERYSGLVNRLSGMNDSYLRLL